MWAVVGRPDKNGRHSFCGCVETKDITIQDIVVSMEMVLQSFGYSKTRCNYFCGHQAQSPKYYLITAITKSQIRCNCLQSMNIFDCDEEYGEDLVGIYCVRKKAEGGLIHKNISISSLASEGRSHDNITNVRDHTSIISPQKFGTMALILVLIALASLVILAAKTYCDHRREMKDAKEKIKTRQKKENATCYVIK